MGREMTGPDKTGPEAAGLVTTGPVVAGPPETAPPKTGPARTGIEGPWRTSPRVCGVIPVNAADAASATERHCASTASDIGIASSPTVSA